MAHLLANYPNTTLQLISAQIFGSGGSRSSRRNIKRYNNDGKDKSWAHHQNLLEEINRGLMFKCCSSTVGSSSSSSECLVCDYGWRVRRLVEKADEIRKAAQVQAEAFHVPLALFDDLFFQFFQAEVLSGLLYKLRNSPSNRYACLVAEPVINEPNSQDLVGVVDVTVLRDDHVLQHLPSGAEEYLYVSGIAVSESFRRKKIATALLKACDMLCLVWGYQYLVLRAYEEDRGARKLYTSAGYQVVSKDPPWFTSWIGRKRRVLMIKRSNLRN